MAFASCAFWFGIGLVVGGSFGAVVMGLLVASAERDRLPLEPEDGAS